MFTLSLCLKLLHEPAELRTQRHSIGIIDQWRTCSLLTFAISLSLAAFMDACSASKTLAWFLKLAGCHGF